MRWVTWYLSILSPQFLAVGARGWAIDDGGDDLDLIITLSNPFPVCRTPPSTTHYTTVCRISTCLLSWSVMLLVNPHKSQHTLFPEAGIDEDTDHEV